MPNPNNPTANGVATELWGILEKTVAGDMTPAAANAATNAGQSIVRIFVQQMAYAKARNEIPEIPFFVAPAEMAAPQGKIAAKP